MSLITISQCIGCGGMTIARLVAEELKLELYDDERLEKEALRMGIHPEDWKGFDEKAPGLFSRIWSNKPQVYLDLLEAVIYEVARQGQGIIKGHGSQVLLRDFGCALHVRIYASESYRVKNLMNQRALSREAAEKLIHKTDSEQRGFFHFAFHMDLKDPSLYDLGINCDKLSTGLAAKLISEAAGSQEIKECSLTALESMEKLSLSRRVDAAILENNLIREGLHIEVLEKGIVHITGFVDTPMDGKILLKVVNAIPGVKEVRSEVTTVGY
jgi:cytidylate kinase